MRLRLLAKALGSFSNCWRASMSITRPRWLAGLSFRIKPDVGEDAGVVEKLVGEHDDGIQPVVFQNPAADFALARTAVAIGKGRAVENDGDAAAAVLGRDHLGEHGLQEEQRAVVHARHAGLVAGSFQLARLGFITILAAPSDAEGRIAQHPVEAPLAFGPLVAGLFARADRAE